MSPYTMPVAATTVVSLKGRAWFMPSAPSAVAARAPHAPRRPHHGAAAAGQAAVAGEDRVDVGRIAGLALDLVVVGQLLSGRDAADRVDEHTRTLDHRLAVGVAGVIHEARLVAVDAGVDHRGVVGDEEEGMAVGRALPLVAPVGLRVGDALAEILEHARARLDAVQREHAESVQRRGPHLDQRLRRLFLGAHTATGALMPA